MGRHHYPGLRLFHHPGGCLGGLLRDYNDLSAFPVFRAGIGQGFPGSRRGISPGRFMLTLRVLNEFRFRFLGIF
jgi:uncharacterized RDD family membrane protein YckC